MKLWGPSWGPEDPSQKVLEFPRLGQVGPSEPGWAGLCYGEDRCF